MERWEEGPWRQTPPPTRHGMCRALAVQCGLLGAQKEEPASAKLPTAFQLGQETASLSVQEQIISSEVSGKGGEAKGRRDWAQGQQPTLNPTIRAAAGSLKGH